jgi:hypothetical protein
MNLAAALSHLRPGIDFLDAVRLQDDGAGPYIAAWDDPRPQPTDTEIAAAWEVIQSAPPPLPQLPPLTPRQLRLALLTTGLLDEVESAVAAANAAGDRALGIWWEYTLEFGRDHPLVCQMAAAIGATPADVDTVWSLGATL